MIKQSELLEIISGRQRGIRASAIRFCFSCLTPLYRTVIAVRNRKFDRATKSGNNQVVQKVEIPVISIGNLTTGGTGKTPFVIWVARQLRSQGHRVALVSRGYGSENGRNDEALEIEHRLPDVPHLQDPDRVKMAQIAVDELDSQIVVLDDAFQHRRIHRDLDIVLIDATCPFGFGRLLPRGLLREPISSLNRADFAVITRSDRVSPDEVNVIREKVLSIAPSLPVAEAKTTQHGLLQYSGTESELSEIAGQKVLVFCGIGNPDNFVSSVSEQDLTVVDQLTFPDHHHFDREDILKIGKTARLAGATAIVCTHKDLVKIGTDRLEGIPVFAILIDVEITSGKEDLLEAIGKVSGGAQD